MIWWLGVALARPIVVTVQGVDAPELTVAGSAVALNDDGAAPDVGGGDGIYSGTVEAEGALVVELRAEGGPWTRSFPIPDSAGELSAPLIVEEGRLEGAVRSGSAGPQREGVRKASGLKPWAASTGWWLALAGWAVVLAGAVRRRS